MSIYTINGTNVDAPFDVAGNAIQGYLYALNGEVVWPDDPDAVERRRLEKAIRELSAWVDNYGLFTANGNVYAKERYRMDTRAWVDGSTAIGCAQAALACCMMWKFTGDDHYLDLTHGLYRALRDGRKSDDAFEMYVYNTLPSYENDKYTGGNSEVPNNLFRLAVLDPDYASLYIAEGLKSTDYLLTRQSSNGSWPTSIKEAPEASMFTAQAMAAIAMGYQYTDRKEAYRSAIEKGFAYISTQLMADGRVRATCEPDVASEKWRPPTSDQSIVIRGLAIVELCMKNVMDVSAMKAFRVGLMDYLNRCIGPEGSVRNGIGTSSLLNDIYGITDHVYTTSWAIEAYYFSWIADENAAYKQTMDGIIAFCVGNIYHSVNPVINGVLRGAYNVRDGNWDTSALYQNGQNEGGADQIYVGWVMTPILSWMVQKRTGLAL